MSLTSITFTTDCVKALRERCLGSVTGPSDPDWDNARQAWNLALDQRPVAVVAAAGVEDILATMAVARAQGLRVSPQATGHGACAHADLADTILLRTDGMRGVRIDPVARRVLAEAGVQWQDVVGRAAEHGLAVMHGSAPDVGVVGYTLGGGLSWYARKLGLAANHVTAIELVTAHGELVTATATEHEELFWALRGGGGSFGIVTAIEFEAFPIEQVYAGWLVWPAEAAREVLPAWKRWTRTLPHSVTSLARLLQLPPAPGVPPELAGRQLLTIEAAILEEEPIACELLAPLRAYGPEMDTFATVPQTELPNLHRDPPMPVPFVAEGVLLERLPDHLIAAALDAVGPGSGSQLLAFEIRHLGGALEVSAPGGGARSFLPGAYQAFAVAVVPDPDLSDLLAAQVEVAMNAVRPASAPVRFNNFAHGPGAPLHDEAISRRLATVKRAVDPENLIRANHEVVAR